MRHFFAERKQDETFKTRILLENEVLKQNISRLGYLTIIGIPVSLIHIIFFALKLPEAETVEHTWRIGIILSHSLLITMLVILGAVSWFYKTKKKPGRKTIQYIFYFFFFLTILIAVAITGIDQLVTSAITPFLVICTLLSVFFLIRPLWSLFFFGTGYLLLALLMPRVQADPSVSLSNIVNGLTALAIAFALSVIMWNLFRTKMKQAFTIAEQARLLEIRNKKLKEQTDSQRLLLKMRDKIFSIIAHDLKSPLNGVLGLSEILYKEVEMDAAKIKDFGGLIWHSTKQTYFLLENLLEWAQMQQHQIPFSPVALNLKLMVMETFALLSENATQKNIQLYNNVNDKITVWADRPMLNSIIRNLVSNAIKFTPKGGTITLTAQQVENFVQISVTDNGVGIDPKIQKTLFAEGWNTSTYGTQNEKGTGLGLVLCKEFTECHGGIMQVESEPGKGSTFRFSIPVSTPNS